MPELRDVWPSNHGLTRRCFELIYQAYIKARYSKQYKITDEELTYSLARLDELVALVRMACERHLTGMGIDPATLPPPVEQPFPSAHDPSERAMTAAIQDGRAALSSRGAEGEPGSRRAGVPVRHGRRLWIPGSAARPR